MSVGEKLAELRTRKGWSRKTLSDETGLSTSYLHYVEHDEVLPSAGKIRSIVEALGGDPEPIIRERDEIELSRLGHDAETTLLLKEEFGDLTEQERAAALRAVRRVRDKGRNAAPRGGRPRKRLST